MSISQNHAYWMADALNMPIRVTKSKVTGKGKLKVPAFKPLRLVCPLEIKEDMHRDKLGISALLVKVRGDLYMIITYDGTTGELWLIDASKVKIKGTFKGARNLENIREKVGPGIVRSYEYNHGDDGWTSLVNNLGK